MAHRGFRGRGRGRGWAGNRGRGGWKRGRGEWQGPVMSHPPPEQNFEFYPLVRPIFDWTEVEKDFPQAPTVFDNSLLTQLLEEHAATLGPLTEEKSTLLSFLQKICTVVDNMIVSGEGESLLLDEVRLVGPYKMGTAMAFDSIGEVVIILKDLPTPALMSKISGTLVECLETDRKDHLEENIGAVTLCNQADYSFEIHGGGKPIAIVHLTSTGEKVYGGPRRDRMITDMKPFENALRLVRHSRWWEDHTHHMQWACDLVRVLIDMKRHVPGLSFFSNWYLQLLAHCAIVPLVGDEPLSFVSAFRRVWELLSAGIFLPGSIGIPDPCEESDSSIHDDMPLYQLDEITRNAQMILQMISFGAYREVLAMEEATPINFMEPYSFGGVTLGVPAPAFERPSENTTDMEVQ